MLICFYSHQKEQKVVYLIDVKRLELRSAYTIANVLHEVATSLGKLWTNVVAISSDSA